MFYVIDFKPIDLVPIRVNFSSHDDALELDCINIHCFNFLIRNRNTEALNQFVVAEPDIYVLYILANQLIHFVKLVLIKEQLMNVQGIEVVTRYITNFMNLVINLRFSTLKGPEIVDRIFMQ